MAARYKERVGERIKAAREAKGWTQTELAHEMPGILDGSSISRWERGIVEPRADNLDALAEVLDVDPSFFLVPEPKPGAGDLIGALQHGPQPQLDRIEEKLDAILTLLVGGEGPAEVLEGEAPPDGGQRERPAAKRPRKPAKRTAS